MLYINNFNKNYNFYINLLSKKLFIKSIYGLNKMLLPNNFFFKITNNFFSILFINKALFQTFLKKFEISFKYFQIFYSFKLQLKGLGFRIRHIVLHLIRFFFTSTNFYYLHIPLCILIKIKKRKLFFISYDYCKLKNLIITLMQLKKLIVYRNQGLVYPKYFYITKPGKKRF